MSEQEASIKADNLVWNGTETIESLRAQLAAVTKDRDEYKVARDIFERSNRVFILNIEALTKERDAYHAECIRLAALCRRTFIERCQCGECAEMQIHSEPVLLAMDKEIGNL